PLACGLAFIGFVRPTAAETTLPQMTVVADRQENRVPDASSPLPLLSPEIEPSNSGDFQDLLAVSPGGYAGNPVSGQFSLRGVNNENIFSILTMGSNPLIAVLENGVPLSPTTLRYMPPPLWGLEQAVVLNGPQIHLSGPNALAGALLLDYAAPSQTNQGKLWFEAATYGSFRGGISQNLVLIPDRLALNVLSFHEESDGYETNEGPKGDETGAYERDRNEIRLRWLPDPSGDGKVDFSLIHDRHRGNLLGYVRETADDSFFDRKQKTDVPGEFPADRWAGSLQADLPLPDGMRLKSTTGYQRFDGQSLFDLDGSDLLRWYADGFIDEERFTQHLALEGEKGNVRWRIGGYYEDSKYSRGYSGRGGPPAPAGSPYENQATEDVTIAAVDGRLDWEFTSRWHLISGIRLNHEDRELTNQSKFGPFPLVRGSGETSDFAPLPQTAIEWRPDERSVIGAKISRAYRAGGISHALNLGTSRTYEEEDGWELETFAGTSTEKFDFRASAFHAHLDNMQVAYDAPGGFPGIDMLITNAADSHRYGAGLEGRWRATPEFSVSGSLGWLHTHFGDLEIGSIDASGYSFPNAPEWTASLGLNYEHPSGFYGSVLFSYADATFSRADNPDTTPLETRKLLSARLGYRWSHYGVYVFGTNLLDDEYALYRVDNTATGGSINGKAGPPRVFGIGCEIHW
ncbi:MAG TPA: TonB-dependent receptor, partial [Luteolibacter sp.]|nr:TonB-dependent receptor [Luteolibacter sp.]